MIISNIILIPFFILIFIISILDFWHSKQHSRRPKSYKYVDISTLYLFKVMKLLVLGLVILNLVYYMVNYRPHFILERFISLIWIQNPVEKDLIGSLVSNQLTILSILIAVVGIAITIVGLWTYSSLQHKVDKKADEWIKEYTTKVGDLMKDFEDKGNNFLKSLKKQKKAKTAEDLEAPDGIE